MCNLSNCLNNLLDYFRKHTYANGIYLIKVNPRKTTHALIVIRSGASVAAIATIIAG